MNAQGSYSGPEATCKLNWVIIAVKIKIEQVPESVIDWVINPTFLLIFE